MLRVDVTKQLGDFSIDVAFASEGRVTGLFGASGAGKTSLFNILSGQLGPDSGNVSFAGQDITGASASVCARAGIPAGRSA